MTNSISQKQIYAQLDSMIPDSVLKATVPIIAVYGRKLQQFGTGTLFRIADQSFVVTAAHVIKDASKNGTSLCIVGENGSFVPVKGNGSFSENGQYGTSRDPFDVAILPIDSDIVYKLGGNVYLRLDDIDTDEDQSNGIFCLCGYPAILSKASTDDDPIMSSKPLQYITYAFTGSTIALQEYQERFHILLNADPDEITDKEGKSIIFKGQFGTRANFPLDLKGISGCSVWKIADRSIPFHEWKNLKPKIVAVQTSVCSQPKVIRATRWVAVSTLLVEAFPKLEPAIRIWRF